MPTSKTTISFEGAKRFTISAGNFGTVGGNIITVKSSASRSISRASEGCPLQSRSGSRQARELNSSSANTYRRPTSIRQRAQPSTSHTRGRSSTSSASDDHGTAGSDSGYIDSSTSDWVRNTRSTFSTAHGHNPDTFRSPIPLSPQSTPSRPSVDVLSPLMNATVEMGRPRNGARHQWQGRQDTEFAMTFGASQALGASRFQVPESSMSGTSANMTPVFLSPETFGSVGSGFPNIAPNHPRGGSPGSLPDSYSWQYQRPNLYPTVYQGQPAYPMNGGYGVLTVPNAHPASWGPFIPGSGPVYYTSPPVIPSPSLVIPPPSNVNGIRTEIRERPEQYPTRGDSHPLPPIPTGIASASTNTPYTYNLAVPSHPPYTSDAHNYRVFHPSPPETQPRRSSPNMNFRGIPTVLPDFGGDDPATRFARLQSQDTLPEGNTLGLTTNPPPYGTTIYYSPLVAPVTQLRSHPKRTGS